jgi:predicted nuclease of restriction endonuclease-like (RecB) superfamily
MKALKNGCAAYVEQIGQAVSECYAVSAEPANDELMRLYSVIGQCICAQGEKAFVVHLAEFLTVRFPQVKGFSPRNLRRMRDFYRTYENRPNLMHKAQTLGWTQNAVILECCENNDQREFYIGLAIDRNLSKLSLMREIEAGAYEQAPQQQDDMDQSTDEMSEPVSDASGDPGVDTPPVINAACGPFVTACEPPRQGDGITYHTETNNTDTDGCNCAVKDRDEKQTTKLIDVIQSFKTERVLGVILNWLRRIYYTLTGERFRIGTWIGCSPPGRWRCPWKTADGVLHPTQ